MKKCDKCNIRIKKQWNYCPVCGGTEFQEKKNKKFKTIVLMMLTSLLLVGAGFAASRFILWSDDKIAFDKMISVSSEYPNADSLRLESGCVINDILYGVISYKGPYGNFIKEYVMIMRNNRILNQIDASDKVLCEQDALDSDKINNRLKIFFATR